LDRTGNGQGDERVPSTIQPIWAANRLQPHGIRTFKRSRDPAFAAKVEDVVVLYMHPPAHALVLSIDEKSQIQALDRTQPDLPLKPGKCGTMTHDYKRHGITTPFAALNILCKACHRVVSAPTRESVAVLHQDVPQRNDRSKSIRSIICRSERMPWNSCNSSVRNSFSGAIEGRPIREYTAFNCGPMSVSASFTRPRIARSGWSAGTRCYRSA
jgi:hypothetical protein